MLGPERPARRVPREGFELGLREEVDVGVEDGVCWTLGVGHGVLKLQKGSSLS